MTNSISVFLQPTEPQSRCDIALHAFDIRVSCDDSNTVHAAPSQFPGDAFEGTRWPVTSPPGRWRREALRWAKNEDRNPIDIVIAINPLFAASIDVSAVSGQMTFSLPNSASRLLRTASAISSKTGAAKLTYRIALRMGCERKPPRHWPTRRHTKSWL